MTDIEGIFETREVACKTDVAEFAKGRLVEVEYITDDVGGTIDGKVFDIGERFEGVRERSEVDLFLLIRSTRPSGAGLIEGPRFDVAADSRVRL